ncbi:MAG: recombinase zinc beta ribbon domain-containing protein, partial [Frankiaceae bacterium]
NGRGVPAAQGGRWTRNTVRLIVLRPINVALRVHRGEVVGAGDWEPILDRGVWEQVRAVLADPARRTSTATRANHLLSGIARCGVCGEPLRAALLGHRGGTPVYRCSERSCVSRNHDQLDDFVTRLVVERLSRPDAVDLLAAERGDDAQRAAEQSAALRARLDNAADDYADGKISRRQLERVTARLNPQIAAADAAARIVDDVPLLDGIIGAPDVAAKWATLPLSRRRGVVDMLLDVRVLRSPRGRHLFDPDAIDAKWKELA